MRFLNGEPRTGGANNAKITVAIKKVFVNGWIIMIMGFKGEMVSVEGVRLRFSQRERMKLFQSEWLAYMSFFLLQKNGHID